jgi:lipopolysaccharide/colanic/teichoic acid biosynthesis glycosyltransferase
VIKRSVDIIGAAAGLIFLAPIIVVVMGVIWVDMGRPVFFRQTRPGRYGRPFNLVKLRSMRESSDHEGRPLSDADRLTRVGACLRALSLDELPGLWNVLRGEMSLVGPRPLLMEYLELYTPRQARRHEVRPGITGWAQINGRNALSWEERLELDVWYVENQSFLLDIKILFRTVFKVLSRDGVTAPGEATVTRFTGTRRSE